MNSEELKMKIVNEINKCQLFGGRFGYRGELIKFPNELLADALIAAGATIREKAKWLWDDEDDAPKCSLCGKRAMYQPKQYGNGAKVCFITLSLYCPHCGAEMEGDICEEDTEEWREQEDLNPFKHALVKQARWWRWKAEALEKESEQLKAENAALRERLKKAAELACKVGDTVYQYDHAGNIYASRIRSIIFDTSGIAFDERAIGKSIFLTKEAAEARLAELKGDTK